MTERQLRRIKNSFVRAGEGCSMKVACLRTVLRYYYAEVDAQTLTEWCTVDGKQTLGTMKETLIRLGMDANLSLRNVMFLAILELPVIIYAKNDFGKYGYAVCFGLHEGRFIVWEPEFGPMQYTPKELNTLWIYGICMTFFPGPTFQKNLPFDMKWWEIYDWSQYCKRKIDKWKEFIELEILPRLRCFSSYK